MSKPIVHLYTICWDEADMLGFFFRHYDSWVDRYVIYDDGSTDGSREILSAHPKVELRNFPRTDPDSFVLSHRAMQNEAWKESRHRADWIVVTAIDEHLHVPGRAMADYLAEMADRGVSVTAVLPSAVDTALASGLDMRPIPKVRPEEVARAVVDSVHSRRAEVAVPGYVGLLSSAAGVTPEPVLNRLRRLIRDDRALRADSPERSAYRADLRSQEGHHR